MKVTTVEVREVNVTITMTKKEASILREILGDLRPCDVADSYKEQTGLDVTVDEVKKIINLYDGLRCVL